MSPKLDVLGIGYPSLDYITILNEEPKIGQTSLIMSHNSTTPYYGGCAVNITYLLSYLGYSCGLNMTVGKDFEESGYKGFLSNNNISLEYVDKDENLQTSYTEMIIAPSGEHMTLFYPGPMDTNNFKAKNLDNINTKYALLAIGEIKANKEFLKICIEKNIPTIFSMKGDYHSLDKEYLIESIEHSEIVFMNETEYSQLNDYLPKPVLSYLERDNKKIIVVTLGSEGSLVFGNIKDYYVPSFTETKVIDTSGGGDAFIAGFLSIYLKNESLEEAALTGTALASYIIEDYGCLTNIPSLEQLEIRKKKIKENINEEKSNVILRAYRG